MGWWFSGFAFIFTICTIISAGIEGQAGLAATYLTASVSTTDNVLNVQDTNGFLTADYLYVEDEMVSYTGKNATQFTGVTRGVDSTSKANHSTKTKVYNLETNVINNMVGYNIAVSNSSVGSFFSIVGIAGAYLTALPRIIMWDYSFLDGQLSIIKWPLYALSIGLVITFIGSMIGLADSIFKR